MAKLKEVVIKFENQVSLSFRDNQLLAKGPKGERSLTLPNPINVKLAAGELRLGLTNGEKALFGLYSVLIRNLIQGVDQGYHKDLELVGVGYKVKKEGRDLVLSLGFSHPVRFSPPPECEVEVKSDNNILVSGIDKELVGRVAAKIRELKKPEPYKGKGIRYRGEAIRLKAGKAGKVVAAVK